MEKNVRNGGKEMSSPRWETEVRGMMEPKIFFPCGYDRSDLQEMSAYGEEFAKFVNLRTGDLIDCEDFYKQYLEELKKL